jgi:hypothetical protein
MSLPRFTGEASVYRTSNRYRMVETLDQADNALRPAMLRFSSLFVDPCVSDCLQFCRGISKLEVREACRDGCYLGCNLGL